MSREHAAWRLRAAAIPDRTLRVEALNALQHKRGHVDGAGLIWTLGRGRDRQLLRTLVAYELLQDYLDSVSERAAAVAPDSGPQLYRALGEALDPSRPPSNYYCFQPWRDDGGYLLALVQACRSGCRLLPSYDVVKPFLMREAAYGAVLVLNHEPAPDRRDAGLRRWALKTFPQADGLNWFEITAAASGWIGTHALLALAARPKVTSAQVRATYRAYFPWFALALTMLDSYVDQADDERVGAHSYIAHYGDRGVAVERISESIVRAAHGVLALPDGERHAVLLACMIALYLSKDSARTEEMREDTLRIANAGGTLPRRLLPVLRMWRICNAQRSST